MLLFRKDYLLLNLAYTRHRHRMRTLASDTCIWSIPGDSANVECSSCNSSSGRASSTHAPFFISHLLATFWKRVSPMRVKFTHFLFFSFCFLPAYLLGLSDVSSLLIHNSFIQKNAVVSPFRQILKFIVYRARLVSHDLLHEEIFCRA